MSVRTVLAKARKIYQKENKGIPWNQGMPTEIGVTHQAYYSWQVHNRMPDSEYSGRTRHALNIQRILKNQVTVAELLGHVPVAIQDEVAELDKQFK